MEHMEGIDSKGTAPAGHSIRPPKAVTAAALRSAGLLDTSDAEGFLQLAFHGGVLLLCASAVSWLYTRGYYALMLLAELPYGVTISFLFAGFHETIHNTAFQTKFLNLALAHVFGFLTFRSATWFWCFHWSHHRFTNDPTKDPELSGSSIDLDDPTKSLSLYLSFLSGYPFGFERVPLIARRALGDCSDPWVVDKAEATQRAVRVESAVYTVGYALVALASVLRPASVGLPVLLYWLLPHCLGAGHLRMYQFAEHRACIMGPYTDTNAWASGRTTTTWWFYRKLAWHMPYHVEHHAFPNVPFHKLHEAHELVRAAYAQEGYSKVPTGCDPDGSAGYVGLHMEMFCRMLRNRSADKKTADGCGDATGVSAEMPGRILGRAAKDAKAAKAA